jgi:Kef-type K+ transport system membrane component KefB
MNLNYYVQLQVETFAQFGVVFLLFALGLEFSLTKLKAVGPVAVIGGLLQIVLFMFLCGLTAAVLIFIYCPLIFFVVFASSYSLFY